MTKARDEVAQNRQAADFMRPGDDGYYTLTALPPSLRDRDSFPPPVQDDVRRTRRIRLPVWLGTVARTATVLCLVAVAITANVERLEGLYQRAFPAPAPDDVSLDAPLPKVLFIRSNPPGARITLDGREVGRTPYAQGYTSAGGHINVRIEAKGYVPWLSTVDLSEAGAGLDVDLKPRRKRDMPALALAHTGG